MAKVTTKNLKAFLKRHGIALTEGGGGSAFLDGHHKRLCIQELTNLFLGGEDRLREWEDSVPCVSEVINGALITANDDYFRKNPSVLVPLVPLAIGTAPTKIGKDGSIHQKATKAYQKKELKRRQRWSEFFSAHSYDAPPTFGEFKKLIKELASV